MRHVVVQVRSGTLSPAILSEVALCVDMATGSVAPEARCPREEVGDGPGDVAAGRRFIRIPLLGELVAAEERQLVDRLEADLLASAPSYVRAVCSNGGRRRMREGLLSIAHALACDAIAQRWLASLDPATEIEWIDAEGFRTRCYSPDTHDWADGDFEEFPP